MVMHSYLLESLFNKTLTGGGDQCYFLRDVDSFVESFSLLRCDVVDRVMMDLQVGIILILEFLNVVFEYG